LSKFTAYAHSAQNNRGVIVLSRFVGGSMSFPEYLRGRVSQDYKNLIIQKLEEIKGHSNGLRATISPSLNESHQELQQNLQSEIARLLETLEAEVASAQAKINDHLAGTVQNYVASWYNTDISSFDPQIDMLISDIISNVPPPPVPPVKQHEELASLCD